MFDVRTRQSAGALDACIAVCVCIPFVVSLSWVLLVFAYFPGVPSKREGTITEEKTNEIACTVSDVEGYRQCARNVEFHSTLAEKKNRPQNEIWPKAHHFSIHYIHPNEG